MHRNLKSVEILIIDGADTDAKCCGNPPLHLALACAILPGGQEFGLSCFELLLKNNANATAKVTIPVWNLLLFNFDFK